MLSADMYKGNNNDSLDRIVESGKGASIGSIRIPAPFFFFFFFFIQFNVPFKIISLIETSQSVGGAKREYPGKTT